MALPSSAEESQALQMAAVNAVPSVKLRRWRDQDHFRFIAVQPCTVRGRNSCEAHHLRFGQCTIVRFTLATNALGGSRLTSIWLRSRSTFGKQTRGMTTMESAEAKASGEIEDASIEQ
jgi:hypothetical protein